MLDFTELSPTQRSTVDVVDKVDTYRGFMRALRYVVAAHLAIGVALALIFFAGADIGTAVVVGAILLLVGFYALMRPSPASPREAEAPRGRPVMR
jgi:hypothetical protein